MPIEKVHFHEVGALDSIADIVGAAIALDLLGVERSPAARSPTGVGTVKCAHGMMPVPAPATAELLKGVPLRPSPIKAELTTPTGAAILTSVVQEWTDAPAMTIERIGHGAGTRDFLEQPNLLRLFVGEAQRAAAAGVARRRVWVLETNLDDVPGEVIGYCFERLLRRRGARRVHDADPDEEEPARRDADASWLAAANLAALEEILFRETGTLGVRRHPVQRDKLQREAVTVETPLGPGARQARLARRPADAFTPEYDDCARVARAEKRPLADVFRIVQEAYAATDPSRARSAAE